VSDKGLLMIISFAVTAMAVIQVFNTVTAQNVIKTLQGSK